MNKNSVTNIEVFKTNGGTVNLAFGFVTICDFLKIRFNVVKGKTANVFVSWPQQSYEKNGEKKYTDLVSFLNEDDRKDISNQVIKEFNKLMGNVQVMEDKKQEPKKQYINVDEDQGDDTAFNYGDNQDEDPPFEPDPPKQNQKKTGLSFRRGK